MRIICYNVCISNTDMPHALRMYYCVSVGLKEDQSLYLTRNWISESHIFLEAVIG